MIATANSAARIVMCACATAVSLLVPVAGAAAQDAAVGQGLPPGGMGPRYVDGSFGFALTPPAGCELMREKRFINKDDVELVRFVHAGALWLLGVRQSKPPRALDPETLGVAVVEEVKPTCEDVSVVKTFKTELASREVLRCEAVMTSRGTLVLRQQAMIRIKPSEYYALVFVTPQSDEKLARPAFDKVLASFELLRSEAQQQQLLEALVRGSSLLQLVKSGSLDILSKGPREVFLRYLEGDREVGFMQIRAEPQTVERRNGLTIFKWFWFFPPDGSVTLLQQDMFVTADLSFEKWQSRRFTLSPPPKGGGQREISQEREDGRRRRVDLLVAYAGKSTGGEVTEKGIEVDATYASAPWDILLPTLVELKRPELYAFSWYDSSRRGLSLQTFRIAGTRTTPAGLQATVIEQSEGLIPPIHELWVDRDGQLLRVVMNLPGKPVEMLATTRQDVERRYGTRVKEIEKLMPAPPPRETAPAAGNPAATPGRAAAPTPGNVNR